MTPNQPVEKSGIAVEMSGKNSQDDRNEPDSTKSVSQFGMAQHSALNSEATSNGSFTSI